VNRTALALALALALVSAPTSTSFAAGLGRLRIPVGPPNMTRNARSPERSPERGRGRISGGPARRSYGVANAVDVQFNESGAESPQQSYNDGDDDEEEEDDEDDMGLHCTFSHTILSQVSSTLLMPLKKPGRKVVILM
jgi:hypothetical protein